jgi:hypothetical protein
MHSLNLLTLAQIGLIVAGLIFQVIAISWLYRDTSGERSDGEHDDWADRKIDLGQRKRKMGRTVPRDSVHDYYEIERTPPGVRPADLRKTARVKYMDNVQAQRPGESEPKASEA